MLDRREFVKGAVASAVAAPVLNALADGVRHLVLVHGRAQEGKDPVELKQTWVDALKLGAEAAGKSVPDDLDIAFPFYGDLLEQFTEQASLPLTDDIQARGEEAVNEDFLEFQAEIAELYRVQIGVTDAEVNAEYGDNPRERGPLNWEWVQAILRAIDKNAGGISSKSLELFTRDVYLYTRRSIVRDAIDDVVAQTITAEPTVVVGHSLGSVVTYSVLRYRIANPDVPLFVTVGCPLGLRSIRRRFTPLQRPDVQHWFNAFDDRDVVALYPLNDDNFPVSPAVENYRDVKNHTDNRHGIVGYLDDREVAGRILGMTEA